MHRIHYTGDTLLTGSDIAHAVLEYARALAEANVADTVVIPVVTEGGAVASAELLIGPASELAATPDDSDAEELESDDTVAELDRRARGLTSHPEIPTSSHAGFADDLPGIDDF